METPNLNRRTFLASAGLMSTSLFFSTKATPAKESPVEIIKKAAATAKINVTALRGKLSVLEGSGGNIVVLSGRDEKLLVDGGIGVSKPNVSTALDGISKSPVSLLINTHWHFDHVDGNLWLHQQGARIVAHENTLQNMSKTITVDDWDYTFPPSPNGALPTEVFEKKYSLTFEGDTVELQHYAPAHTDSDISVYFPKWNVLHVADTWWNGHYPFIDYNTKGSIEGMIVAAHHNVTICTEDTIVVPGHGPIGNRQQLVEYKDMLEDIYNSVRKLKQRGRSMDEIVKANPTAKYDAKWGTFVISPSTFVKLVYKGV